MKTIKHLKPINFHEILHNLDFNSSGQCTTVTSAPSKTFLCRRSHRHYEAQFTHTIVTLSVAD